MSKVSASMPVTHGLVRWSPCMKYLAAVNTKCLMIREAQSHQILQRYSTIDVVQSLAWSKDSQLVLTAVPKRAIVQIWSVQDALWTCKISEGIAGLVYARWTPDARHVVTVSDFQLHASVWSLEDPTVRCTIQNPKLAVEGLRFSTNGEFLAVVERHDCKDFISIFSSESWKLLRHFLIESYDCVEIEWSPDDTAIAVRDTHLEFRALLYSPDGTLLAKFQAYENALGLKTMTWSPSGQFLAMGSYDEHLRILSHIGWKPVADFDHESIAITSTYTNQTAIEFEENFADTNVMNRPQGRRVAVAQHGSSLLSKSHQAALAAAQAAGGIKRREICFVSRHPPFSVRTLTSDPLAEHPKIGISRVTWSANSAFIATKSDQMPYNVWIWRTETLTLHSTISLLESVRSVQWDPVQIRLAITSGENRVHIWTVEGISTIDIPIESFQACGLQWASCGDSLLAVGRQEFCSITL